MRIITSSRHKDYYDRFSDPTDSFTTWVRTPELIESEALSLHFNRRLLDLQPQIGGQPLKQGVYLLGPRDLKKDEQIKKQGETGPFVMAHEDRYSHAVRKHVSYAYEVVSVVFCGKFYRGLIYYENHPVDGPKTVYPVYETLYRVYWSAEQVAAEHMEAGKKDRLEGLLRFDERKPTPLETWFTPVVDKQIVDACIQHDTPVFIRAKRQAIDYNIPYHMRRPEKYWMKNATWLDSLQFIKVMDPHAAFQELSMFVGGVMVKTEPIHQVPDKLKVQSHGMDEMSFRKEPTKVHR